MKTQRRRIPVIFLIDLFYFVELEGIVKGEGTLFTILDFLCELVLGTFHFYFILALHLGFRPQLYDKVNKELIRLNRIIEQGHKKYNDSNLASSVDGSCLILPLVLLGLLAYDAHSSCQRKLWKDWRQTSASVMFISFRQGLYHRLMIIAIFRSCLFMISLCDCF